MRDRTKLKPAEFEKLKGTIESFQYRYDEQRDLYVKQITKIRGVAAARRKSKRFILATVIGKTGEMYLMADGRLTKDKKKAKFFYYGFDDPAKRSRDWSAVAGITFFEHKY